ncbi:hypothetical protein, partial [Anaerolentibacter hominis]|uniref:hypothetical protein n=1 Tax=Anaerolentibacter hominis TaxID=3079009 RepID=UPI0031B8614D
SNGVFTPAEAGQYEIMAQCLRGKNAEYVRASATLKVEVKANLAAEQTGVQTVKVTGADSTTLADYVLKRGSTAVSLATVTIKDGAAYLVTTSSTLPAGDYTLTYKDNAPLSFKAVAQEITSVETVGTNLVANADISVRSATIEFKILNQFGERMGATVNASCTLGKATTTTQSTKNSNGKITVADIPATVLVGQTGTLVLVESSKGISITTEVTYSGSATPTTMTSMGVYDLSSAKFVEIAAGDKDRDRVLVLDIKDQYGNSVNADTLNKMKSPLSITPSAGLTGLTIAKNNEFVDITIDKVDYVSLAISGTPADGTCSVVIVNPLKGLLGTVTIPVGKGKTIESFTMSTGGELYAERANEIYFTALDANGNELTKYDDLKDKITFASSNGGKFDLEKGANGVAKLMYTPVKVNEGTSRTDVLSATLKSNYKYTYITASVKAKAVPKVITGMKTGTTLAVVSGEELALKGADFIIEDQYGNIMTADQLVASGYKLVVPNVAEDIFAEVTAADVVFTNANVLNTDGNSPIVKFGKKASGKAGSIKVIFSLKDASGAVVDDSGYTVTLKTFDQTSVTDYEIKDFKYIAKAGESIEDLVKVIGRNGSTIVNIPTGNVTITSSKLAPEINKTTEGKVTKTATVEVVVDGEDGPVTLTKEYKYSNEDAVATTIEATDVKELVGTSLTKTQLTTLFSVKDQYGDDVDNVKYLVEAYDTAVVTKVEKNGTQDIEITATGNVATSCVVTATAGSLSKSVTINIKGAN